MNSEFALQPKEQARGLSGQTLKWIAIVAMLIDHIASRWFPLPSTIGLVMHIIGRITGPIMFYLLAEGMHYTRSKPKYLVRLGIFAVISWPAFVFYSSGHLPNATSFTPFGVIYTLFLAAVVIYAAQTLKNKLLVGLVAFFAIVLSTWGDWPIFGILIPLFFYIYRGNFKKQAISYISIVLLMHVPNVTGLIFLYQNSPQNQTAIVSVWQSLIMAIGMALPIILLKFYKPQKGGSSPFSKWFFYIFYPAHLVLIRLVYTIWSS